MSDILASNRPNARFIDLTGKKFGKLTVLRRAEHNTSDGKVLWVCRCDCGRKTTVDGRNLRRGVTQSCGCLSVLHGASMLIDLTGQRFGKLTVLGRAKKNGSNGVVRWVCRCDCGRKTVIRGANLKRQQACGSCKKERNWKLINLTGKQFGRLTVVSRAKREGRQWGTLWRCRCACGRHTIADSADLRSNRHQSCGCAGPGPQSVIDMTGKRFGNLTVLKRSPTKPGRQSGAWWKCRCDCGRLIVAYGSDLRLGRKVSCGCQARRRFGQTFPRLAEPKAEEASAENAPGRRGRKRLEKTREIGEFCYQQLASEVKRRTICRMIQERFNRTMSHSDVTTYARRYVKNPDNPRPWPL